MTEISSPALACTLCGGSSSGGRSTEASQDRVGQIAIVFAVILGSMLLVRLLGRGRSKKER